VYCHENEHARVEDARAGGGGEKPGPAATHKALAGLADWGHKYMEGLAEAYMIEG